MSSDTRDQVTIIGCGYVGLTTAAILANCDVKVHAIEINPERLHVIKSGRSFFYEAGIEALLAKALQDKTLMITDSYAEAVPGSSVVFSCVGTPDNPDGSSNLSYVYGAAAQAVQYMEPGSIYAQKSTVPVGTGAKVMAQFEQTKKAVRYVSNPEFLREGTAVSDTLWPDRVVAGGDVSTVQAVLDVYRRIEECREQVARTAGLAKPERTSETRYVQAGLSSAELIKVTANAFLALKISFANSITKLADQAGADVVEVMDAVGADRRIGRAFLNAGRGYGGGCFPKDVSGLIRASEDYGVGMEIMKAATAVNDSMPHYIISKAQTALGGSFKDKRVVVLGLAFKAGTSDTRRSPAITIANTLADLGAHVTAYDPQATEEAKPELHGSITLADAIDSAVKNADCVFVATDWPEFKAYDWQKLSKTLIVDCMNCLHDSVKRPASYIGVGKG